MVRPPDMEHAVVQALGRAGRKKSTGQRGFSLLYLLYNAQDLGVVKGPSPGIERLCRGEGCKKQHLRSLFEGVYTKDLVAGDVACCAIPYTSYEKRTINGRARDAVLFPCFW